MKDKTAARRTAALKARLIASGGKRLAINLYGKHVEKLDQLVETGFGKNHSDVIRVLLENI